jgi:PAS domain S-box-containing protein
LKCPIENSAPTGGPRCCASPPPIWKKCSNAQGEPETAHRQAGTFRPFFASYFSAGWTQRALRRKLGNLHPQDFAQCTVYGINGAEHAREYGMQTAPAQQATVLTVEDDPVIRETIAAWLEDSGLTVLQAEDGSKGLDVFRRHTPDLVLLDLGIPGMSGESLLKLMVQEQPDTPVIIVSGTAEIDAAISAFKNGAWDFITKPVPNMELLEKTVRNCLERKSLRERLDAAETRYFQFIQHLPVTVFSMDGSMQVTWLNAACPRVLGWPVAEALGTENWFMDNVHPPDRPALQQALEAALQRGNDIFCEFSFRHRHGYLIRLQARSTSVSAPDAARAGRIEGVLLDITDRDFLDKVLVQREKLNTLGAMADEVAHEFRNPLFALGGFARRLHARMPDIMEAGIILEEAKRMETMLDRLKEYTSPVDVSPEPTNVNTSVNFALDRLEPQIARRRAAVSSNLEAGMPEIQSDPDILLQVLMNLVTNLLDAMPEGETLRLITSQSAGTQEVTLMAPVQGTPMADPEQLLLPFDVSGPQRNLAVSYRLVKTIGGLLSVTRSHNVHTLTLSLPAGHDSRVPGTGAGAS